MRGFSVVCGVVLAAFSLGTPEASGQERAGMPSWGIETLGAMLGSSVGAGIGIALADRVNCNEDVTCEFGQVGFTLALASAGAWAGDMVAGRWGGTEPSGLGAALGAVAGAAAGLGVAKLAEEVDTGDTGDLTIVVSFSLTQGLVTALGSRIAASAR